MALGRKLREAREEKELSQSEVASGTRMKVQMVSAIEEEDFSDVAAPIYGKGFIKLYAEFVGLDPQPLINEYVNEFVNPPPPPAPPGIDDAVREVSEQEITPMQEQESQHEEQPAEQLEPAEPEEHEPDLFSVSYKRHEQRTSPRPAAPPRQKPAFNFSHVQQLARNALKYITQAFNKAVNFLRPATIRVASRLRSKQWAPPQPSIPQNTGGKVAAGIGILLVVILVVSSLHSCFSRSKKPEPGPGTEIKHDLRPAFDPPEPYIDR
ncbi:MAG: helix-turn-helix domain-containing protein [Verrucomicrobiota bacterium]